MGNSNSSEYKLAIFGAIAGVIFTAIYDWVKEKPILSTLSSLCTWIWKNIFEFEVRVWSLISFIILFILIKNIISAANKNQQVSVKTAKWLNYKVESIDNLKWKWKWRKNGNIYSVNDLRPLCPKCETAMNLDNNMLAADCPRCEKYISNIKNPSNVEAIILDNIDRELYEVEND